MNISLSSVVGEVVKNNYKTAPVFQSSNIDYCCRGNKTIDDACREAGIEPGLLISQLETLLNQKDPDSEYINNLSLGELASYIVKRHHAYVHESIPVLKYNLDKICRVHGEHHPELFDVNRLFTASSGDLTKHMQKEEIMLFPYIQRLETVKKTSAPMTKSPFGSVSNPIGMMMAEHQVEGERFEEISKITKNYELPGDACTTYAVTLKQLSDFEADLHRHIHLENNILFPKAIQLENE